MTVAFGDISFCVKIRFGERGWKKMALTFGRGKEISSVVEVSVWTDSPSDRLAFIEITLRACNEDDAQALDKEQYAII